MSYSPDGRYWWDGQAWQPAISPDGRLRWTGTEWVPIQPAMARPTVLQPTAWTRPLQLASAGLVVLQIVWGGVALIGVWFALTGQGIDALVPPDATSTMSPSELDSFRQAMQATIAASFGIGAVVGLGWTVVILIGCLKRWRWVFWYLMIVGLFSVFGLLNIPAALALQSAAPATTPFRVPAWIYLGSAPIYLLTLGLSVWMVVALRRFGTWACVRVPVS